MATEVYGEPWFRREERTVELADGLIGYYQEPDGACLQAAVATVLQRPIETVPNIPEPGPLLQWAQASNIDVGFLNPRTDPRPEGLCVGVTPALGVEFVGAAAHRLFGDCRHTVVLRDGRVFFDPASAYLHPSGGRPKPVTAIEHAITLTPKEDS